MMVDVASLVSDNLDIWTTAVERKSGAGRGGGKRINLYGIDRLRALILELAVQGKLVPQDPEDEPAADLLKRIKVEKIRLAAAGKVKLGKPLRIPASWPFEIPGNWAWSQLGFVTNYGQIEKADPGTVPPEMWVLELEDVEKGTSRLLERVRSSDRPFQSQKNMFQAGDVVYGKLRPYLDKVIIADEVGVCSTEMVPMRGYGEICSDYIRLFLKAPFFIELATEAAHGMNLPRLGTEKAREAPFALPPLAEQLRIVAKVDELMALCDALEAESAVAMAAHLALVESLLATLTSSTDAADLATNWARLEAHFDTILTTEASVDALKQTALELAVRGNLVLQVPQLESVSPKYSKLSNDDKLPVNWRILNFGRFCDIQGGNQPPKSSFLYSPKEGYVQLIQIRDLGERPVLTYIPIGSTNRFCKRGEILIGRYGASVGKVFWANDGAYNVALAKFIWPEDALTAEFAFLLLKSSYLQEPLANASRSAQAGFNKGDLANINFPLPPILEQERIVATFYKIIEICDSLKHDIFEKGVIQVRLADAIVEQAAA